MRYTAYDARPRRIRVAVGLVTSLARPGGNITGFSNRAQPQDREDARAPRATGPACGSRWGDRI